MRLPKERVAALSKTISETLLHEGLIGLRSKKEALAPKIEKIILDDLQVEDRLNAEVKEILKGYEREMEKGEVDYQKMFQMIKKQLVKERDLVL
ncbi:MAG TPA: DUF507 family protein [Candidatus Manganitrophaceae bacterium]|nr:DUF507 family protein [Candidatus Manganitrophaceae bacterium]